MEMWLSASGVASPPGRLCVVPLVVVNDVRQRSGRWKDEPTRCVEGSTVIS